MTGCPCNNLPFCLEQPFLTACEKNDIKSAEACLNLKADPNIKTKDGLRSGLLYAAEKNYPELLGIIALYNDHSHIKANARESEQKLKIKAPWD